MSISKSPGHMRSIKLNVSATVLTFGLESENFLKFKTLLSESFGGNCARAPRLTAVWPLRRRANIQVWARGRQRFRKMSYQKHIIKRYLPGILRMKTVRSVASPVIMLKIVSTTKAVEAVRKTKEKRYMRGIMAQP